MDHDYSGKKSHSKKEGREKDCTAGAEKPPPKDEVMLEAGSSSNSLDGFPCTAETQSSEIVEPIRNGSPIQEQEEDMEAKRDSNDLNPDNDSTSSSEIPSSGSFVKLALARLGCGANMNIEEANSDAVGNGPEGNTFSVGNGSKVFEYEWPPKCGETYFLQEQIGEFLDVKSFKRKYPDLTRRMVDKDERDFLRRRGFATEMQADLGLTALRAVEVMDLMAADYPEQLVAYQMVVAERNKKEMAEKQREYDTIKADSRKLAELRKRAMRSAFEWNQDMNRERKRERRGFWDLQTMVIQTPTNRWKKLSPEETNPGAYPFALIPGQFHNGYRRLSSADLHKLPTNTATDSADLMPVKRRPSPPPIVVDEYELEIAQRTMEENARREAEQMALKLKQQNNPDIAKEDRGIDTGEHCAFCQEDIYSQDNFVQCAQCGSSGHPTCMEMNEEMFLTVKAYPWMCMDCKACSVCTNLDEEDKMMFCDKCDRGYHTFCVGLDDLPSGRWVCAKFCTKDKPVTSDGQAGENEPMVSPGGTIENQKCRECDVPITKENKVHHRSKFRHSGLCANCVKNRS